MTTKKKFARLLIVDDTQSNLDLMKGCLKSDTTKIVTARDGKSALTKLKAYQFDLILLDIVLPDIDGFEIFRQMKEKSLNISTPVIYLTANADKDNMLLGFQMGAVDFIRKPFMVEELVARVNLHLSLKYAIEDLEKAKMVAEKASQEKSLFLANMSHEIRTPLNGIVGMIDILEDTDLTSKQKEYLEIMNISSDSLLGIINDILDFSKIEAGQIILESIPYNFHEELNKIYKLFYYKVREKSLEYTLTIDPDVPVVLKGDPVRLRQILVNLINNAIKFTSSGSVRIKVSVKGKKADKVSLLFEVSDTGIGISEANCKKLFKSFSQADSSTTRKFGGTGLGLAISKRLTMLMDGKIGVNSNEGEGSTFWFTINSEIGDEQTEAKCQSYSSSTKRELRILMAEDNQINQKVYLILIKRLGSVVDLAVDGLEAVKCFEQNVYDLILMDIQMPNMDGIEATRRIRQIEKQRGTKVHVPVVAMSANRFKEDIAKWKSIGMDDYLGKPFKLDELIHIIDKNVKISE